MKRSHLKLICWFSLFCCLMQMASPALASALEYAPPCYIEHPIDDLNHNRAHREYDRSGATWYGVDMGGNSRTPVQYDGLSPLPNQTCSELTATASLSGYVTLDYDLEDPYNGGWGNVLEITNSDGDIAFYGHFDSYLVNDGDYVEKGDPIAIIGSTGYSVGSSGFKHTHFEARETSGYIKPYSEWEFAYSQDLQPYSPLDSTWIEEGTYAEFSWTDMSVADYCLEINGDLYPFSKSELSFEDGVASITPQISEYDADTTWRVAPANEAGNCNTSSSEYINSAYWTDTETFTINYGIDPEGVDFTSASLSGLTIDSDTGQLQFIISGEEAESGDTVINLTEESGNMKQAFLQALAIPNYKHFISLDLLVDEYGTRYGSARTFSPFEETDIANILFDADVEMKFDGVDEILGGSSDNGWAGDWVDLIQGSPYWSEFSAIGFETYPNWVFRKAIMPGDINVNVEDGTVYISDYEMTVDREIMSLSIDLSSYSLSEELTNEIYRLLDEFEVLFQTRIDAGADAVEALINSDDPEYAYIREIYPVIALAQWYKTLDIDNKPYEDLIDSEDLTGLGFSDPLFDDRDWDSEAYQYIDSGSFTGMYGGSWTTSLRGGVSFYSTPLTDQGEITDEQEDLIENIIDEGIVQDGDDYYIYAGSISVDAPDLRAAKLTIDTTNPVEDETIELELNVSNYGKEDSGSFVVNFYDQFEGADGTTYNYFIGQDTVSSLAVWDTTTASVEWAPWYVGQHTFVAVVDAGNSIVENNESNNNISQFESVYSVYPDASIFSPSNSEVLGKTNVQFEGYGYDAKDLYLMDDTEIEWESDIDGVLGTGYLLTVDELTAGTHTITMTATNSSGYSSEESLTIHVVEPGYPLAYLASPVSGQTLSSDVTYSFIAESEDEDDGDLCALADDSEYGDDPIAVSWESSLDGYLGDACSLSSELSIGTHDLTFTTTNSSGLSSSSTISVIVEEGSPTISIDSPLEGAEYDESNTVSFQGTATDLQDGDISSNLAWYSDLDGHIGDGATLEATLSPGTHTITLFVVDSNGLSSEVSVSVTVTYTGPESSITTPVDGDDFDFGSTVVFEGSASDLQDGVLTGDSLVWESSLQGFLGTGDYLEVDSLVSGNHEITLTATDSDGVEDSTVISISVDIGQPEASLISPVDEDSFFYGDTVNFSGSGLDELDGALTGASLVWSSSLDGELGTGANLSLSSLSYGEHTIRLTVTDSHGWTDYEDVTITVEEPHDPEISLALPRNDSSFYNGEDVYFIAHAMDYEDGNLGSGINWNSDLDGDLGVGDELMTNSLSIGSHTITASVSDSLGATVSLNVSITVEQNLPIAEITSPDSWTVFAEGDSVTLTGSGTDYEDGVLSSSSLSWSSDLDGYLGTGSSTTLSSLSGGTHSITLTVTDSSGSTGTTEITIVIQTLGSVLLHTFSGGQDTFEAEFSEAGTEIVYIDVPHDADVISAAMEVSGLEGTEIVWEQNYYGVLDGEYETIFHGGITQTKPAFADYDRDGDEDLFLGEQYGEIWHYENDGSGNFTYVTDSFEGIDVGEYSAPAFLDIDSDGDEDMFIGNWDGVIWHYENDGSGNFTYVTDSFEGIDVSMFGTPTFADYNCDGDEDLFVGDMYGAILHYENDGSGNFTYVTDSFEGIDVGFYAVPSFSDIDGDGDEDLLIGERYGDIWHYENDGLGNFTYVTDSFEGLNFENHAKPAFSDIDGDGIEDLFVGNWGGFVDHYENDGSANFSYIGSPFTTINAGFLSSPTFADYDNDGDEDLFIGSSNGFILHYDNDGSGNLTHVTDSFESIAVGGWSNLAFSDMDSDGDQDLLIGEINGNIWHYENDGSGSFTYVTNSFESIDVGGYSTPTFSDYDDDGDEDLFIGDYYDGHIWHYENDGSGNFSYVTNYFEHVAARTYAAPVFFDIDSDGDEDLFVGENDDQIWHYENDGSGNFSYVTNSFEGISVGGSFPRPEFADFDGDDDEDLFIGRVFGGLLLYENTGFLSPEDPTLDIASDSTIDWSYIGEFSDSETTDDFADVLNDYSTAYSGTESIVSIPATVTSDSSGVVELSNLNLQYYSFDLDAPVISSEAVSSTEIIVGESFSVYAEVTDNIGVESVELIHDSISYPLTNTFEDFYEITMSADSTGIYDLELVATDTAGLETTTTLQLTVLDAGIDLSVGEEITFSSEDVYEGDAVIISATAYNFGNSDAGDVEFALLVDGTLHSIAEPNLAADSEATVEFTWTAEAGEHTLAVQADPYDTISETDETNNETSVSMSASDMTAPSIDGFSFDPDPVVEGDSVTIQVQASDDFGIGSVEVDWLGQSQTLTYDGVTYYEGVFDANTAGESDAQITVYDSNGLVATSTESITVNHTLSDLRVNEFDITVAEGSINLVVHNDGGTDANDFSVMFYLDGVLQSSNSVSVLGMSDTTTTFDWGAPIGVYELNFVVDANSTITEYDETNNEATVTVTNESALPPTIDSVSIDPNPAFLNQDFDIQVSVTSEVEVDSVTANWLGTTYTLSYDSTSGVYQRSLTASTLGNNTLTITATAVNGISSEYQTPITVEEDLSDLSLSRIGFDRSVLVASETHVISTILSNEGSQDVTEVEVSLMVDSIEQDFQTIDLTAGTDTDISFDWTAELGVHDVSISVDPDNLITESDETNNEDTKSASVIDIEAPIIEYVTVFDPIYEGGNVEIEVGANDNVAIYNITVSLSGTDYLMTYNSIGEVYEVSFAAPSAGEWQIDITATDTSDLSYTLGREITVNDVLADLDVGEFSYSPDPLSDGELTTFSVDVENAGGTDANNVDVKFYIDGTEMDSTTIDLAKGASDTVEFAWTATYGEYDLDIIFDTFGSISESDETNNSISEVIYVFDTEAPPSPTPTVDITDWTDGTNFTISWDAVSDDRGIKEYSYRVDQGAWTSVGSTTSVSITETTDGIHNVYVRAEDNAYNISDPGVAYLYLDTVAPEAPVIELHSEEATWSAHESPYITWLDPGDEGSGVIGYEATFDGSTIADIGSDSEYHPTLTTGTYTIQIRSIDALGHTSDWSNSVTVYIDLDNPDVPVISSTSHPDETVWVADNTIDFSWTEPIDTSSISGYYYLLNQESETEVDREDVWYTDTTVSINGLSTLTDDNAPLSDGTWYMHVAAVDEVGNMGETGHYTVLIDTTAPHTDYDTSVADTITLVPYDPYSGVSETWYSLDSGIWTSGTTVDISGLSEYTLEYYSIDSLGNTEDIKTLIEEEVVVEPTSYYMETGMVTGVDENWVTVTLENTYVSPVIVAVYHEDANTTKAVSTRIQNVGSNSFEVRLQEATNTDPDADVEPDDVYYVVVEEGQWTFGDDDTQIEAKLLESSTVSSLATSYTGDVVEFDTEFDSDPLVLHQVMSYNDENWISSYVSWILTRYVPPRTAGMLISLLGGGVTSSHASETIGWIAIENNIVSTADGIAFETLITPDEVLGHDDGSSSYVFQNGTLTDPRVIASQLSMDGENGSWAALDEINSTGFSLYADEDQIYSAERYHASETMGYFATEGNLNITLDEIVPDTFDSPIMEVGSITTLETAGVTMEVDTVSSVGSTWTSVSFTNTNFVDPVVITSFTSDNNTTPASVRIRNVSSSGFEVALQSPDNTTTLLPETVQYMAVERGTWFIDGHKIEADSAVMSSVGAGLFISGAWVTWPGTSQSYMHSYSYQPIVMHQVQTANDEDWIESWVSKNGNRSWYPTLTGFYVGLNGSQATYSHDPETVGWIVMDKDIQGEIGGVNFESQRHIDSAEGYDDGCYTYSYSSIDSSSAIAFASLQELYEGDGGWAVFCSQDATSAGFYIDEDQEYDSERSHSPETMATISFSGPVSTTYSNGWTTVHLDQSYTSPVIVATPHENYVENSLAIRINNITSTSFDVMLQEPSGATGFSDDLHYIVIEEGQWQIGETKIEAHLEEISSVGSSASIGGSWSADTSTYSHRYDDDPIVLHQVMSYNDEDWITTWASKDGRLGWAPDKDGLQLGLNGAQATTTHNSETVGWIAIENYGMDTYESTEFITSIPSTLLTGHDDGCFTYTHGGDYTSPVVIGSQMTMSGGDGSWLRICDLANTYVGFHLEEDQEYDEERNHTTESFGYIIFEDAFSSAGAVAE